VVWEGGGRRSIVFFVSEYYSLFALKMEQYFINGYSDEILYSGNHRVIQ
jgi:hypothetical protein